MNLEKAKKSELVLGLELVGELGCMLRHLILRLNCSLLLGLLAGGNLVVCRTRLSG